MRYLQTGKPRRRLGDRFFCPAASFAVRATQKRRA
jgi:hypothetical protein